MEALDSEDLGAAISFSGVNQKEFSNGWLGNLRRWRPKRGVSDKGNYQTQEKYCYWRWWWTHRKAEEEDNCGENQKKNKKINKAIQIKGGIMSGVGGSSGGSGPVPFPEDND